MALIKCPECGKEISDKAPACIHCGFPLSKLKKEKKKNIFKYDGEKYDLNDLVKHIISHTDIDGFMDTEAWETARNMLKNKIPSYDDTEDINELISYIIKNKKSPQNDSYLSYIPSQPSSQPTSQLRCPKCGSTSITTEEEGYSLLTGFWGASRKHNLCQKCGYRWKPGKK